MLAVPVLAGSAAYAVAESFDWKSGLDMKLHEAMEFYGIIAIATVGGVALNFTHLDPMRALVWSAEINGVIAVPDHGRHDVACLARGHHGPVRHPAAIAPPGLGGDRRDGGHGGGHVRHDVRRGVR